MNEGKLTDKDRRAMDRVLERLLDAYKTGQLSRAAVGGLAHVMAARDVGNTAAALSGFNQGGVSYVGDSLERYGSTNDASGKVCSGSGQCCGQGRRCAVRNPAR
ncbi:hypothetical protein [Caballeronia sp. KNU42]